MKRALLFVCLLIQLLFTLGEGNQGHARQKRVVGGDRLRMGAAPYLVSIKFLKPHAFTAKTGLQHVCGGNLVRPNWVLTSAHCFDEGYNFSQNTQDYYVSTGEHDQKVVEEHQQDLNISKIIIHPGYVYAVDTDDVALVKLTTGARLDRYTATIPLDSNPGCTVPGASCFTSGWGQRKEEHVDIGTRYPYRAFVTPTTLQLCNANYSRINMTFTHKEICAVSPVNDDACMGDSGGPLVCRCDCRLVLSGLVFTGEGCGRTEYPGVYERVSAYLPWVNDTIATN